jgi:Calcineurin-like phosphoesterase
LKTWPNSSLLTKGAGSPITAPVGLIINGDLTAYFHPDEEELYRQFYHTQFTLPVYPGLGNHDHSNNVKTATSGSQGCSDNVCADRAIKYLKSTINCSAETNFPATQVSNYDDGSMAYSFEIGKYHFVQLNFYPGYTKTEISVTSSNAWLQKDLAAATKAGKRIVINLHTNDSEAWASDSDFLSAIQNQNVVAIFGAHIHPNSGFQQYLSNGINNKIPFIRSGSPHFSRFMLVQFGDDYINFAILSDTAGVPAFVSTTDSKYLGTY